MAVDFICTYGLSLEYEETMIRRKHDYGLHQLTKTKFAYTVSDFFPFQYFSTYLHLHVYTEVRLQLISRIGLKYDAQKASQAFCSHWNSDNRSVL